MRARIISKPPQLDTIAMRKLDCFPGFTIVRNTSSIPFNPFQNIRTSSPEESDSPSFSPLVDTPIPGFPPIATRTFTPSPPRQIIPPEDLPPTFSSKTLTPSSPKPTIQPEDSPPTIFSRTFTPKPILTPPVPMIQPRSKEGQRLLYRYPHLPKVGPRGCYELLVGQSDKSDTAWLLQFDGAANPNPGPASSGAVLWTPRHADGERRVSFESGKFLGKATNNIAEVQGLYLGLQVAANRGARELLIEGDSELIIFHQTGKYKVSDRNLKGWWAQIQAAMMDESSFDWIAVRQVPREENQRADSITKEVLGRKQAFVRAY